MIVAACASCRTAAPPTPESLPVVDGPNLLIVVSDTLRRDHLGCYGYDRPVSPEIDAFANDSAVFDFAFAQTPSTKPSIASLFTSLYPSQHRVVYNENALPDEYATLAEILRDRGYATAGFVENPIIGEQEFGYTQGFDFWALDRQRHTDDLSLQVEPRKPWETRILEWIASPRHRPFFFYVHYIDPHYPYRAPDGYFGRFHERAGESEVEEKLFVGSGHKNGKMSMSERIGRYDEEIRYVDDRFGRLIETLRRRDLYDDTIVMFLSDHGEGFAEHGYLHHSSTVYGDLVNIPLILRYPSGLAPGRYAGPVQHIDVLPTLVDLLGVDTSRDGFEGRSILEVVDGDSTSNRAVMVEHLREGWGITQRGLILDPWKLVVHLESGKRELFDSRSDPLDLHDLSRNPAHRDIKLRLGELLDDRLAGLDAHADPDTVPLDEETRERLESLGYIR
jgi:arylsulfatase A-like enzyme